MSGETKKWRKLETLGTVLVAAGLLMALPAGAWHGYSGANDVPADWIVDLVTYSAAALVVAGIGLNIFNRTRQHWEG